MILLIAYGNPLRQDDGAGLRLAEQMAGRWQAMGASLRHVVVQQLAPELAVEIAAPEVAAVVQVQVVVVVQGVQLQVVQQVAEVCHTV